MDEWTKQFVNMVTGELTALVNIYYTSSQTNDQYCSGYPERCVFSPQWGAIYNPQYILSIPWMVMDFLSCMVLFFAAIFSWWLRRTLTPDIFGFVSSLTRDNPNFAMETGTGSMLSGLERARLLGKVKAKIGDVAGDTEAVGRVGLSHVVEGFKAAKLQKERKYA